MYAAMSEPPGATVFWLQSTSELSLPIFFCGGGGGGVEGMCVCVCVCVCRRGCKLPRPGYLHLFILFTCLQDFLSLEQTSIAKVFWPQSHSHKEKK